MRKTYLPLHRVALPLAIFLASCSKKEDDLTPPPPPPPPGCVAGISPANGGFIANSNTVQFTWSVSADATAYDLYLGTSPTTMTVAQANITGTSHTLNLPGAANTTYYWYALPKRNGAPMASCSSAAFSFTLISIQAPPGFGYYVVGYFPSYRNPADVPDVKFRMTNVVNYAFFSVNTNGKLDVLSPSTLAAVITKARANNAKVFFSINDGAGDGRTNFRNMAATASGRNEFVKDVMAKVRQYGFDGVDVDWEFPTTSDGTDITFTALMKELSDSLHRDARYYLSAAIVSGKYAGGFRDAIKAELFGYVDFFNLMAYDDFSTSVPFKQHSDFTLATVCLNYWLNTRSMPVSKCVLGIPAYGRPSGITQTGTVLSYKSILAQGGNPLLDSAVVSAGGFTNYTIYYNGQYTAKRKAKYAQDVANGVMLWEKWQDATDQHSILKAVCDTIGRPY
jgi:GH18 family chitinase